MVTHPNRSKKNPKEGRNPSPVDIFNARIKAGLTQPRAAAIVYKTPIAWRKWEAGERRMPPDTWELFLLKLKDIKIEDKNTAHYGSSSFAVCRSEADIQEWAAKQESKGFSVVITPPTGEVTEWKARAYKVGDLSTPDPRTVKSA